MSLPCWAGNTIGSLVVWDVVSQSTRERPRTSISNTHLANQIGTVGRKRTYTQQLAERFHTARQTVEQATSFHALPDSPAKLRS